MTLPAHIPDGLAVFQPEPSEVADLGFHYRLPVGAFGEDGDVFTLGHVPTRLVIATANRAWRTQWGERLRPFDHAPLPRVTWQWVLFTRDQDDEWLWRVPENTPGAVAVTVVCGQEGTFAPLGRTA